MRILMREKKRKRRREGERECRMLYGNRRRERCEVDEIRIRNREGVADNRIVISQTATPSRSWIHASSMRLLPRSPSMSFPAASILSVPDRVACRVLCRAAIYLILSPVNNGMERRENSERRRRESRWRPRCERSMIPLAVVTTSTDKSRERKKMWRIREKIELPSIFILRDGLPVVEL